MTDRKYVVLNTSIQTGSNASQLLEDADGNVAAQIELRLPDNIFSPSEGGLKVDTVSMLTTKFRVSLSETPIASIPLDSDLSSETVKVSTCKLDVYPFVTKDDGTLEPYTKYKSQTKAFPFYKSHNIVFNFYTTSSTSTEKTLVYTVTGLANTYNYLFPKNSPFYPVLNSSGVLKKVATHCLNLAQSLNHTNAKIENDKMFLNGIGALEHLISDALANALLYASTSSQTTVDIDLASYDGAATLDPRPISDIPIEFEGTKWVIWKYVTQTDILDFNNVCGIHPKITINENSMTLSYDTAAFGSIIPVLWNTSFISNYDMPIQTTLDNFLAVFYQPPPKRIFKYGLADDGDDGYHFTIPEDISAAVFNIIGNKIMKETFPFLPWIKLSLPPTPEIARLFDVKIQQRTATAVNAIQKVTLNQTEDYVVRKYIGYTHGDTLPIANVELPDDGHYYYLYTFSVPLTSNTLPVSRYQQEMYWGNATETSTIVSIDQGEQLQRPISSYETVILPPVIDIISEETTATPAYPVGNTEIDTRVTYTEPILEGTNTYTNNELIFFFPNTEHPTVPVQFGATQTGNWDSSTIIKVFPCWDPDFIYRVPSGSSQFKKYVYIYSAEEYLLGRPNGTVNYTVDSLSSQKILEIQEAVVTEVSNLTIPDEVDYIPNIYDGEDLYMLDCSSVNLSIGEQEPMPEAQATKFQIDRTTTTRNDRILTDYRIFTSIEAGSPLNAMLAKYNNTVGFGAYQMAAYTPDDPWVLDDYTVISESAPFLIRFTKWRALDGGAQWIRNFWLMQKIGGSNSVAPYRLENIVFPNNAISTTETVLPPETETETTTSYSYDPSLTPGTVTTPYELIGTTRTSTVLSGTPEDVDVNEILKATGRIQLRARQTGHFNDHNVYVGFVDNENYRYTPEDDIPYINSFFKERWIPAEWAPLTVRPDIGSGLLDVHNYAYHYLVREMHRDDDDVMVYTDVVMIFMDDVTLDYSYNTEDDLLITTDPYAKINDAVNMEVQTYEQKEIVTSIVSNPENSSVGNLRLNFTWSNLPTVILSPIQSFVMLLSGMQVTQEIQPINIAQAAGSSLVSTVPIIENYYSLAQTLRDLHDELVVVKDSFNDAVTYKMKPSSGMERTLTFTVKYLTKDGRLHQLYIPKNGVFTLQLTFELSYYMV